MEGSLLSRFLLLQWMVALSLWKVVFLSIFNLLQWMVALSLWKVVCCRDLCYSMDGSLVIMEGSLLLRFFTPMDDSLVIMDGSLLSRFLLLQWMVALSLWNVVCCRYFCFFQWIVALSL